MLLQIVGERNFQDHRIAFPETQTCVRPGLVQRVESITWWGVGESCASPELILPWEVTKELGARWYQPSLAEMWGSRQGQRWVADQWEGHQSFLPCLLVHPTARWRGFLVNT